MSEISLAAMIELAETLTDQGRSNEAVNMLSPLVESDKATDSEKLGIRITLSKALSDLGRMNEAVKLLEAARTYIQDLSGDKRAARLELLLAYLAIQMSHSAKPINIVESVLHKARLNKWIDIEADCLAIKAHIMELRGDYEAALGLFQQAFERARTARNLKRQVTTLSDIARVRGILGQYSSAFEALEESSRIAKHTSLAKSILINKYREALLKMAIGEYDQGRQQLELVEDEAAKSSLPDPQSAALHQLGLFYLRSGEYDKALSMLSKGKEIASHTGLARQQIYIQLSLARLFRETGDRQKSIAELTELWVKLQPLEDGRLEPIPEFLRELALSVPTENSKELLQCARVADEIAAITGIYEDFTAKQRQLESFLNRLPSVITQTLSHLTSAD
jgi:tetratricopeptide (TPR) repeat protein